MSADKQKENKYVFVEKKMKWGAIKSGQQIRLNPSAEWELIKWGLQMRRGQIVKK